MQLCDKSWPISLAIFIWLAESKAAKSSCLSCLQNGPSGKPAAAGWAVANDSKRTFCPVRSCPALATLWLQMCPIVPKHTAFVFWVLIVKQGRLEARQITLRKLKWKSHSYGKDLICHDKSLMLIFLKRNLEYIISILVFLYWYKN